MNYRAPSDGRARPGSAQDPERRLKAAYRFLHPRRHDG
jgi:hypothetical protein